MKKLVSLVEKKMCDWYTTNNADDKGKEPVNRKYRECLVAEKNTRLGWESAPFR